MVAILNINKSPSAKYQGSPRALDKEIISVVCHCDSQHIYTAVNMNVSNDTVPAAHIMLLLLICLKTGSETENDICRAGGSGCLLPVVRRMMTSFLAEVYDGVIE